MPKNFYNLPPSWNPGYAIPESVMDEGLERRTFVTAMEPRGTFDNPKVGNAGYAVPQYVDEEGLGRGAFTTKMLPRGYYGPKVPNWLDEKFSRVIGTASTRGGKGTVVAMQTMGDTEYAGKNVGVFGSFGQRAAATMIANAKRLPAKQQAGALKAMMDRIDPSLYGRAGTLAAKARSRGASPQAALAHGIASAMTEGMLGELHKVGKSRTAPQARSLLGLGCYGCAAALGADLALAQGVSSPNTATLQLSAIQPSLQIPVTTYAEGAYMDVGPWRMPVTAGSRIKVTAAAMTSAQKASFASALAKAAAAQLGVTALSHSPPAILASDVVELSTTGLGSGKVPRAFTGNGIPLYKFTHPTTKKLCVMFTRSVGSSSAPAIELWWNEYTGLVAAVLSALIELVAVIVDAVKEAISIVGDLACQTVSAPGAAAAAAAASGGAAAVGVSIAGGLCGGSSQQPPPPPPAPSSPILPIALLGGGALLIVALNKKKKAS